MAHSLDPACTPLKHKYDACFNTWFEAYLQPVPAGLSEPERAERQREKQAAYEATCGKVWEAYRGCMSGALTGKGLDDLLKQAREEDPLIEPDPPETVRRG